MSLVYSRQDSGLVVAEHSSDEAAISRALKQHDPELRLVRQVDLERLVHVWKVYAYRGSDTPAVLVLVWQTDDGEPLPLSSRLVERVKAQDRNSPWHVADEDERNAQRAAARQRDWDRDTEALADDWQSPHGRPVLHRGQHLRVARDKRRRRGENI